MSTVDKQIADTVVHGDGLYPGDHERVLRIVEYTNQWDGKSYGLEYKRNHGRYVASRHVRNPRTYWEFSPVKGSLV